MLRRLSRLLIIALIVAVIAFAASRLMGGDDDDFDDFDDLDSGFEFQETPVEIDVPVADTPAPSAEQPADAAEQTATSSNHIHDTIRLETGNGDGGRLIDINGIGPAYEARLQAIGINSIHELAHADAEQIASKIEVIGGAATIGEWITQAQSYHTNGHTS